MDNYSCNEYAIKAQRAIDSELDRLQYYIDGIFILGREELKCTLPTINKLFFHQEIKYAPKQGSSYIKAIGEIQRKLGIKQ